MKDGSLLTMEGKILIIPDVHGRSFWKSAVCHDGFSKIIFLGDYVDPYPREGISDFIALHHFKEIISFKKYNPDKVVLLLGNHDLHYYSELFFQYAGGTRYNKVYAQRLYELFMEYRHLFQLAYETETAGQRFLFTHAGVVKRWYDMFASVIGELDADHLNALLDTDAGILTLTAIGKIRGGPCTVGSMVWADVHEMSRYGQVPGIFQIFGHTMMDSPFMEDGFACLDCQKPFVLDEDGIIDVFQ